LNQDESHRNKIIIGRTVKILIIALVGTLPLVVHLSLDIKITTNFIRNLERQIQYEELGKRIEHT